MYEATVSGATDAMRQTVNTATALYQRDGNEPVSVTDVAKGLKIHKTTALRRVRAALRAGWLVNAEQRKGYPAKLQPGEPLPERAGLPNPEELEGFTTVSDSCTEGATRHEDDIADESGRGCTVAPVTGGDESPGELARLAAWGCRTCHAFEETADYLICEYGGDVLDLSNPEQMQCPKVDPGQPAPAQ